MPFRTITGFPQAKKGQRFLVIKEGIKGRFIVKKLKKRKSMK